MIKPCLLPLDLSNTIDQYKRKGYLPRDLTIIAICIHARRKNKVPIKILIPATESGEEARLSSLLYFVLWCWCHRVVFASIHYYLLL